MTAAEMATVALKNMGSRWASEASLGEDEHTRDESREIATDIMATFHLLKTNPLKSFDSLVLLLLH
jgi:hypothetical protein